VQPVDQEALLNTGPLSLLRDAVVSHQQVLINMRFVEKKKKKRKKEKKEPKQRRMGFCFCDVHLCLLEGFVVVFVDVFVVVVCSLCL
jgi:hypothetical protein